jgi:cyclopropane fatty-acyl-phospholipid synthase-like methyltransferase
MKNLFVRKIITIIYPIFFPILFFLADFLTKITSFFYYLLMKMDWGKIPRPEWMDHDQDTYYQYNSNGTFHHFERGIIPRLYLLNSLIKNEEIKNLKLYKKINILDLCSGDSYISQKFFYDLSDTVVSLDLDLSALKRGKNRIKKNRYMNKKHYFFSFDIEKSKIKTFLKDKKLDITFDIVLFNGAIEHFKEEQLDFIFSSFREVMKKRSFASIYTIIEKENEKKYLPEHHEMFFSSKKHLENVVSKYFKYTKSYYSISRNRYNIYCIASDIEIKI